MPTTATLTVASPCHESWDAMTPTAAGRHCVACQKVVVDFTQKTDAEILAYLARVGSQPCGRFRAEQLARPLQLAETTSRWRSWLGAVLALGGVLGGSRAAAQASGNYFSAGPTPTAVAPAAAGSVAPSPKPAEPPAAVAPNGAGGPLLARGVVVDSITGDPLPGAAVVLVGTTRGVSTTADGKFELALTEQDAAATLLVSSVGYTTQRLPVASTTGAAATAIKLQADTKGLMGEVVIVGGYSTRRPWPWHPRALYHWGKYWLARPFRP